MRLTGLNREGETVGLAPFSQLVLSESFSSKLELAATAMVMPASTARLETRRRTRLDMCSVLAMRPLKGYRGAAAQFVIVARASGNSRGFRAAP